MTKSEEIMALRGMAMRHKGNAGAEHQDFPVFGVITRDGQLMVYTSAAIIRAGDEGRFELEIAMKQTETWIAKPTRDGWIRCYRSARFFVKEVIAYPHDKQGGRVHDYR